MNGSPKPPRKRRSERKKTDPAGGATRVPARSFRPRIGRSELLHAAKIITPRDRRICHDLYDHHVLTTTQISDLHFTFTNPRTARRRLRKLYLAHVLDNFERHRESWGSHPLHYIMGEIAMRIVATDRGLDLKRVRYRLDRDRALASSSKLTHLIETNDFFAKLARACRAAGDHELVEWWSEQRSAAAWKGTLDSPLVRPDGQGVVKGPERPCSFTLELDRGTERGDRLATKLYQYQLIAGHDDSPDALLFLFPSFDREVNARRRLDVPIRMQVATSHSQLFQGDPLGEVWLPVDFAHADSNRRRRLMDLSDGSGR